MAVGERSLLTKVRIRKLVLLFIVLLIVSCVASYFIVQILQASLSDKGIKTTPDVGTDIFFIFQPYWDVAVYFFEGIVLYVGILLIQRWIHKKKSAFRNWMPLVATLGFIAGGVIGVIYAQKEFDWIAKQTVETMGEGFAIPTGMYYSIILKAVLVSSTLVMLMVVFTLLFFYVGTIAKVIIVLLNCILFILFSFSLVMHSSNGKSDAIPITDGQVAVIKNGDIYAALQPIKQYGIFGRDDEKSVLKMNYNWYYFGNNSGIVSKSIKSQGKGTANDTTTITIVDVLLEWSYHTDHKGYLYPITSRPNSMELPVAEKIVVVEGEHFMDLRLASCF